MQLNFVMFFSPSGSWPIILETTDWDQQVKGGASTAIVALHSALFDPGLILLVSPSLRQSKELFSKVIGFLRGLEPAEVLDKDNKSSCTLGNGAEIRSFYSTHHRRRRSGPASPSASECRALQHQVRKRQRMLGEKTLERDLARGARSPYAELLRAGAVCV